METFVNVHVFNCFWKNFGIIGSEMQPAVNFVFFILSGTWSEDEFQKAGDKELDHFNAIFFLYSRCIRRFINIQISKNPPRINHVIYGEVDKSRRRTRVAACHHVQLVLQLSIPSSGSLVA